MNNRHHDPIFSFELFPPKTPAGLETMQATVKNLGALGPAFYSVTYGAGGSTRDRTDNIGACTGTDGRKADGIIITHHRSNRYAQDEGKKHPCHQCHCSC